MSSEDDEYSATSDDNEEELVQELCRLAAKGEQLIPDDILARTPHTRLFVSRGIRMSFPFAKSAAVAELCTEHAHDFPEFTRARHARMIMSDEIPDIDNAAHFPYCIWYPDVAHEETYAEVARRYPALRYHVGRACAVAGYTNLYRALQLQADVSIAEEALDNVVSGQEIYRDIVSNAVTYAVMDDYTRTVNLDFPRIASLNNDAAVRSGFNIATQPDGTLKGLFATTHWDITEDSCVTGDIVEIDDAPLKPEHVHLLYSPLPTHLPLVNKDLLILMAAYEGNIDRYVRLRRPHMIHGESYCILRGIHHSTTFARWWSYEIENNAKRAGPEGPSIRRAINARFIMSNDLSRITQSSTHSTPYMIWYPHWPRDVTLAELARIRPDMKRQVAHACIVADYQAIYDTLDVQAHPILYLEAKNSTNSHYVTDLERRAQTQGIDIARGLTVYEGPEAKSVARDKEATSSWLYGLVNADVMCDGRLDEGLYERGDWFSSNKVDLFICATDQMRDRAAKQVGGWMMLHVPWEDDEAEQLEEP
jgi:hypothetical protein